MEAYNLSVLLLYILGRSPENSFAKKKKKLSGTGSQNPHVGMSPKCVPRDSKFLPSVTKGKRMAHNLGSPLCLNIQEIRSDYSYFKD